MSRFDNAVELRGRGFFLDQSMSAEYRGPVLLVFHADTHDMEPEAVLIHLSIKNGDGGTTSAQVVSNWAGLRQLRDHLNTTLKKEPNSNAS